MLKLVKFLNKEIMEIIKTPKIIILSSAMVFFAVLSPLTARYTKDIIALFAKNGDPNMLAALSQIPDPLYIDSYTQWFKNLSFLCFIVLILVLMGTVVEEKTKGSIILVLTKGISRMQFILSKFIAAIVFFTLVYVITSSICIFYTAILFDKFIPDYLLLSLFMFWVYGILVISITLLASVVSKSPMMSALFALSGLLIIAVLASVPIAGDYTPGIMNKLSLELFNKVKTSSDAIIPVFVSLFMSEFCLLTGIVVFNKQDL